MSPRANDGAGPSAEDVASLLRASARDGLWLSVDGISMLPTISAASQVRVQLQDHPPRIGEIWAFCNVDGAVFVHRYRHRGEGGALLFQGDNVRRRDEPVHNTRLIGKVTHVRRDGETQQLTFRGRLAWIVRQGIRKIRRRLTYRHFRRRG
jgi:Peptidase S24-like